MQLHRSRPEPRLSTFERCWLGNATGRWRSGQAGLRDLFSLRSPEPALPHVRDRKPNGAPRSMNGINARQRLDSVAIARAGASFSQLRVCRWYIHSRTPYPSANPRFNPHTMSKNDGAYSNRKPVAAVLLSAFLIDLREGCRYSTFLGGHSRPGGRNGTYSRPLLKMRRGLSAHQAAFSAFPHNQEAPQISGRS